MIAENVLFVNTKAIHVSGRTKKQNKVDFIAHRFRSFLSLKVPSLPLPEACYLLVEKLNLARCPKAILLH
ncbi:unnamed protein product [Colias eurytheme]|nr:unnamed protein product [Colias eurytheme]